MPTTTENTTGDIFTALENLKGVQVSKVTRELTAKVRSLTDHARPIAGEVREMLTIIEGNTQIVLADLLEGMNLNEPGEVEQGLWDLMQELSGGRELFNAMQELCNLCDPDRMATPQTD